MPYYNFSSSDGAWKPTDYDCCVVGAGAAGILLAIRLSDHGKRVLLLESGHFSEDEDRQQLNEVVCTAKALPSAGWGRKRAVGGTTIAWGGQSLPFSALDFEKRPWIPHSGWPITKSELDPYYRRANAFMGIDTLGFDEEIFDLFQLSPQGFDPGLLIQHFSKWAPQPNFRKLHDSQLQRQADVVYNAHVTKISFENEKEVQLEVSGFAGQRQVIAVPKVVLATGGIETNRLLLLNRHQCSNGIGNHSGWLGKCFMEHPCMEVGILTDLQRPFYFQRHFNTHVRKHVRYSPKISISAPAQQRYRLLNASTSFLFDYPNGDDPYNDLKLLLKTKDVRRLFRTFRHAPGFFRSFYALQRSHFYYKHRAVPKLGVMLEQEPLTESAIQLSAENDMFGQPKAAVNWMISPLTWQTAHSFMQWVQKELRRTGFGEVVFFPSFYPDNSNWRECLSDVNHHMGGTRMSSRKEEGVVNSDCQVWEHPNLFLASSSVFPTGSHSNPTLTILALAERLANHLLEKD